MTDEQKRNVGIGLGVVAVLLLALIIVVVIGRVSTDKRIAAIETAGYAKAADIPPLPDLSQYAKKSEMAGLVNQDQAKAIAQQVVSDTLKVLDVGQSTQTVTGPVTGAAVLTPTMGVTLTVGVTQTWPAGWPRTAEEFLAMVTTGQPASDGSWMPVELGEISHPVGEPFAWRIAREKNLEGKIIPFWIRNPTSVLQDGWMHDPADRAKYGRKEPVTATGSGIPAGWFGLAEGATFRP